MRIVIVGGGIAAAYLANNILEHAPDTDVLILSKEKYRPYDRIHLCSLMNGHMGMDEMCLELDDRARMELEQEVTGIDAKEKKVFTAKGVFSYDYVIIATGSKPKALFDISNVENAATFRSADDSIRIRDNIKGKNVVIMGVGPIGLEMLDTLTEMEDPKGIYLISRGEHLYGKDLDPNMFRLMGELFTKDERVHLLMGDNLADTPVENGRITHVKTENGVVIDDPFLVFGVGISPNVAFAKGAVQVDRGVVVDETMRSSDPYIFAVGEAAQIRGGFVAGRVKQCTNEADVAIANILGLTEEEIPKAFKEEVAVDGLKVANFYLVDVTAPGYNPRDPENETLVIQSRKENRIDQYILNNDRLKRFVGINTNVDVGRLRVMIEENEEVDAQLFYSNRLLSEKGRMICSCVGAYEQDIVDVIRENACQEFGDMRGLTNAGRVCGRCKQDVVRLIEANPVSPEEAARIRAEKEAAKRQAQIDEAKKRIEKFNRLHPKNKVSSENLDAAISAMDMQHDYNKWISMVTSSMNLHPGFESAVTQAVENLNKIPIIWLEMSDCSGNSEAFIKSTRPTVEELIFDYVSLDYHELLMTASGDQSESALEEVIHNDAGKYVLIVEGAIPLGLNGNYLRIGPKGDTGLQILKDCAKNAALVIALGTCAFDGGVVAAAPNPTEAVGVAQALGRNDIINLPGCPTNPINVVGTLLHYVMFEELPELDDKNRPKWAYGFKIHDNCERRGHYDLDEFVLEWGDDGAKKGWCLFKMGCKGPYADLNCSLVKFNEGTSWPVQAGHGCFACGAEKAFDKYANEREVEEDVQ